MELKLPYEEIDGGIRKKNMRSLGFMGEEGKGILEGRYASWREFGPA